MPVGRRRDAVASMASVYVWHSARWEEDVAWLSTGRTEETTWSSSDYLDEVTH